MEVLLYIPLGLIALTIVVFLHELGHFAAARAVGVEVEAFAIGWGKVLWAWKPGATEYRLCLLPLGGYCKMRGDDFVIKSQEAQSQVGTEPPVPEPGSFHAASPWRRLVISLAGPIANLVLALAIFWVLQITGTPQHSTPARVVLLEAVNGQQPYPSQLAGLQTGDLIQAINQTPIRSFTDVQVAIARNGTSPMTLQVDRKGSLVNLVVTPRWITEENRTMVGIADWVDLRIETVTPGKSGDIAGLQAGDTIVQVNGVPVANSQEFLRQFSKGTTQALLTVNRAGNLVNLSWIGSISQGVPDLGIAFHLETYPPQGRDFLTALPVAVGQTISTVAQMGTGLLQLVSGKSKASDSLSGPLRISYLMGEQTTQGFALSWFDGFTNLAADLAFLSLALFFMNLLPIPALDGGSALLHLAEGISRRTIPMIFLVRYQQFGGVLILLLVVYTLFNDTSFLIGPK
jgi:regulator of sigma E protease